MKTIYLLIIIALTQVSASAGETTLTFLGDSRALHLGAAEDCGCSPYHSFDECADYMKTSGCGFNVVRNAVRSSGARILADGAVSSVRNLGKGGLTAEYAAYFLNSSSDTGYESHVTHVSLGGNDLNAYMLQFSDKLRVNGYMKMPWNWEFEAVTDQASVNTERVISFIIEQNSTNKVILNDVAPILAENFMPDIDNINKITRSLFKLLNDKYMALTARLGDRVQYLGTADEFLNNLESCRDTDSTSCMALCRIGKRDMNCYKACAFFASSCYYYLDGVHYTAKGNEQWGRMLAAKLAELKWYDSYTPAHAARITDYSVNRCGNTLSVQLVYDEIIDTSGMDSSNSKIFLDHRYSVYESRPDTCVIYHPQMENPNLQPCRDGCVWWQIFGGPGNFAYCLGACDINNPPTPAWNEYYTCMSPPMHRHDRREVITLPYKYSSAGGKTLVFEVTAVPAQSSDPGYDFITIDDRAGEDGYALPAVDVYGYNARRPYIGPEIFNFSTTCP